MVCCPVLGEVTIDEEDLDEPRKVRPDDQLGSDGGPPQVVLGMVHTDVGGVVEATRVPSGTLAFDRPRDEEVRPG